ncbi:hypothetical protein [Halomonas aestuarii]|nr:hypothetical protein [Halomonas aestuarii]
MYLDTHVIASLALIASMLVIGGVGVKLLRQAIKRDAADAR